MNKLISLLILMILNLSVKLNAQSKQLKNAETLYQDLAYVEAKKVYEELVMNGANNANVFLKLGDIHYFNSQYKEAATWYKKAYALNTNPESSYNFRYGQSLKAIGAIDQADLYLNKYYRTKSINYTPTNDYFSRLKQNNPNYAIKLVDFNTQYSDYPGFYSNGKLYVITADPTNKTNSWNEEPASDIFVSDKLTPLGKPINTKYNEGSLVLTKDGLTMYFTRNDYEKRKLGKDSQEVTRLKLFRTDNINGQWSEPKALPFNNSEYSVGHPALSSDETKLYFVSDMPGGKGGTDLYESQILSDGTYGIPVNLIVLNTVGNEMFPFVDAHNTLYFSSNGHPNIGGLDVYFATINKEGALESPQNIGAPINSSYDDFAFVIDQGKGYFASNRINQNDQIYSINQTKPIENLCEVKFVGKVIDQRTGKPVPNANVIFINGYLKEVGRVTADNNGQYSFKDTSCGNATIIRADQKDYFVNEVVVSSNEGGTIHTNIPLTLRQMAIKPGDSDLGLLLNPIYFDLDKSNIRPDAKSELDKIVAIMNQYPTLEIDVRSHTDSRASDGYNLSLSQKRAQSTIAYLIEQGIDRNRLSGSGYGETKLVNACANGVKCPETSHQENRRSEFIIKKR